MAFRPDGNLLAGAMGDQGRVQLWRPATAKLVGRPLTGHTGYVPALAFNPDGDLLATASADGTIRLWGPES